MDRTSWTSPAPISSPSACSSSSKDCSAPTTRWSWPSWCWACRRTRAQAGASLRTPRRLRLPHRRHAAGRLPDSASAWVKLLGGLYLLYLTYSHFCGHEEGEDRRQAPKAKPDARACRRSGPRSCESSSINLAFSIDSILVAVAMSPKLWVVITGGILGIVAMRLVVGQLIALVQRYPALVDGAFIIIAWVGFKLCLEYLHDAGLRRVRDPAMAVARPDRRDLRRSRSSTRGCRAPVETSRARRTGGGDARGDEKPSPRSTAT